MLSVKNVNKSFTQGERKIEILKDLNLEISNAQSVAILGQSGSGKSTFLSTMSGIDAVDSGDIIFNETNLTSLDEDEITQFRGRHMGIIFQQFHLLSHLNALENVSLPLEIQGSKSKEATERARKLLVAVGLGDRLDHFPSQLSGGEKQRVAIARSMILDPEILLADEPSGSLDEDTGQQIMDLIFGLVKEHKSTLILVTHNQQLARRCEKVYRLEQGQLHDVTDRG